jgi:hypothetical protein
MNIRIRSSLIALSLAAIVPYLRAAENKPAPEPPKKPLRVLTPAREGRPMLRDGERREKIEMETVAFLGVETAPVSITTGVQLGLPRGTGLVVNHIVPKSGVDGVLEEHDILLKLDDQILIETRQLSVLIRNRKEGDEVVLTYLRGGQKATAKVKLGKTEVPKTSLFAPDGGPAFPGSRHFELFKGPPGAGDQRADVDRVLSMINRGPGGDPVRIQIDRNRGPGFRAMTLHTANSNIAYSDDDGSLELTTQDGVKTLVAKNAVGEELFAGPVTTPEERGAMPAGVRARLEKLEGMHDVTFRTDADFKGGELRVMRPRGIAYPLRHLTPTQPLAPAFY